MKKMKLLLPLLLLTSMATHAVSSSLYLAGALASGAFAAWNGYQVGTAKCPKEEDIETDYNRLSSLLRMVKDTENPVGLAVYSSKNYTLDANGVRRDNRKMLDRGSFVLNIYQNDLDLPEEERTLKQELVNSRREFLKKQFDQLKKAKISTETKRWLGFARVDNQSEPKYKIEVRCSDILLKEMENQQKAVKNDHDQHYEQTVASCQTKEKLNYLGIAAGLGLGGLCLWQWSKR